MSAISTTQRNILIGIGIAFALTGIIIVFIKKNAIMDFVIDANSEKKIMTLHPKVRDSARLFLKKAKEQGVNLIITSGNRSYSEQDALYAKGRTAPGAIVTNAKAGESSHNFATAIDVVEVVNGKANWNGDWDKIAKIGKSVGFAWGGDWQNFSDKPHFEMNFGHTQSQLRNLIASGKTKNGFVDLG